MKKVYYIITLMFAVLLVSCANNELANTGNEKDDRVSISAEIPGGVADTRAQITVPSTHQLRSIIEVWSKEDRPELKYRNEVVVDGGTTPNFDFALSPGDYTCLVWTDFIKKDAVVADVTTDNDITYKHFEDFCYDTSDLHNVFIKDEKGTTLFDTDLCDGFFANLELEKSMNPISRVVKLVRPFAQLIVKEKNAGKFAALKSMQVNYEMSKGFNVATGEPVAGMMTAVYAKSFQTGDDSRVLFTSYLFTPSTGLALGATTLSLTTTSKTTNEIPSGSINLVRNQRMTASGNLISGEGVDPDPEPEPSRDPLVGDYFFKNGTWGDELTDENKDDCIGLVYAVGPQTGDDISNYPDSDGKSIKGYVVALKPLEPTEEFIQNIHKLSSRLYLYNKDNKIALPTPEKKNDIVNHNGYAMTQKLLSFDLFKAHLDDETYPALQCFYTWLNGSEVVKPARYASEWYIPSARQILDIIGGSYGFAARSDVKLEAMQKNALATSLTRTIDLGIGSSIGGNGYNMFNSSLNQNDIPEPVTIQVNKEADKATKGGLNTVKYGRENVAGYVRPVLTIIK